MDVGRKDNHEILGIREQKRAAKGWSVETSEGLNARARPTASEGGRAPQRYRLLENTARGHGKSIGDGLGTDSYW